jgi:hypothetical protein
VLAVFDERVPRTDFADDAGEIGPQSRPSSSDACTLAGARDVLAWEAARDDVDASAPRQPVEGPHVVPDRESWQTPIPLARKQDATSVFVDLDSADGAKSAGKPSEYAASCPCK